MLSREQIDERLATWALDNSQREALETAQKLGEWIGTLFNGAICEDRSQCDECRWEEPCVWLRGEGGDAS